MCQSARILTQGEVIVNHFLPFLAPDQRVPYEGGQPKLRADVDSILGHAGVSQVINDKLNSGRMMSKANSLMPGISRRS